MTAGNINMLDRKSIRHPEHDYSLPDWYFITICVKNFKCVFDEVKNNRMVLNNVGLIVKDEWLNTPIIRKNVKLHEVSIRYTKW